MSTEKRKTEGEYMLSPGLLTAEEKNDIHIQTQFNELEGSSLQLPHSSRTIAQKQYRQLPHYRLTMTVHATVNTRQTALPSRHHYNFRLKERKQREKTQESMNKRTGSHNKKRC